LRIKIKDRVILAILSGTISAAIANTFGYLTKWIYAPTVIMPEVAAELFVNSSQIHTLLGIIFGNTWSFIVGGIHAAAYIFTLDFTGWRYLWWKSFAVTSTGWLLGVGLAFKALGIAEGSQNLILPSILFYGAHLVYLTTSAFIISKYGVPREQLEEEANVTKNNSDGTVIARKRLFENIEQVKEEIQKVKEQITDVVEPKRKRRIKFSLWKK